MNNKHFEGKSVPQHLKEARIRGAQVQREAHGLEASGAFASFFDSLKDSSLFFLIFWIIAYLIEMPFLFWSFAALGLGLSVWKWGRSSMLGYARLERLHRLIEEERYEILHHREQEKQELKEMYSAKGFKGKMLDDVVEILMADDNRLLQVMLEEELGLTLESFDHPLKQGFAAGLGALCAALAGIALTALFPLFGMPLAAGLLTGFAGFMMAREERNKPLHAVVWHLSVLFLAGFVTFFSIHLILSLK